MKIIDYILWWIYPKKCPGCGKFIHFSVDICPECDMYLERIENLCLKCGCEKYECVCKNNIYRFSACVAAFRSGSTAKRIVYGFKMNNNLDAADFISDNMYKAVASNYANIKFDAVTSVPMELLASHKKGYNHSEVLADKIAKRLDIPYRVMLRKNTHHIQHKLSRKDRFDKIKGVFSARGKYNLENVLLVDDIKTTGATLNECTRLLKFAGVKNVYCATAIAMGRDKQ